jgi:hypothetical protein
MRSRAAHCVGSSAPRALAARVGFFGVFESDESFLRGSRKCSQNGAQKLTLAFASRARHFRRRRADDTRPGRDFLTRGVIGVDARHGGREAEPPLERGRAARDG